MRPSATCSGTRPLGPRHPRPGTSRSQRSAQPRGQHGPPCPCLLTSAAYKLSGLGGPEAPTSCLPRLPPKSCAFSVTTAACRGPGPPPQPARPLSDSNRFFTSRQGTGSGGDTSGPAAFSAPTGCGDGPRPPGPVSGPPLAPRARPRPPQTAPARAPLGVPVQRPGGGSRTPGPASRGCVCSSRAPSKAERGSPRLLKRQGLV